MGAWALQKRELFWEPFWSARLKIWPSLVWLGLLSQNVHHSRMRVLFLRNRGLQNQSKNGSQKLIPLPLFGSVFVSGLAWPPLASFGFPLASLERSLGLPWIPLGPPGPPLGLFLVLLWGPFVPLEPPLGLTWASFGLPVASLGSLGPPFAVSWAAFRLSRLLFGQFPAFPRLGLPKPS